MERTFSHWKIEKENRIFEQFGRAGIDLELIAFFRNGRVEQFKAARALRLSELEEAFVVDDIAYIQLSRL